MKKKIPFMIAVFLSGAMVKVMNAQTSGNITYTLYRESNPTQDQSDAYRKIVSAMDSAIWYYNKYTTLSKSLNVYYNTGVQTADANFNGTIRFGTSRSYMVVHTAMHEIAHTIGIGTTTEYRNLIRNKIFTGTHATAKLREITDDPSAVVNGDNQHFWPFGLNYANEITGVKDLINHCHIVNAIYQDLFHESFYGAFRLKAKVSGKFIYAQQNDLLLGNRQDSSSIIKLVMLNDTNTFRLESGNKVLDIPNESRDAGTQAKLWDWNGGAHQRVFFEFQSENVVRIRMVHSGLYLQPDGDRIIQDRASQATENQFWELITTDDPPVKIVTNHFSNQKSNPFLTVTNNRMTFHLNDHPSSRTHFTIFDLQGKIRYSEIITIKNRFFLPELSSGTYIAKVHYKNGIQTLTGFIVR